MPFGGAAAEARLEPLQELARQRDFRQENENLLRLATQRLGDGLEIDFRLSRPCHAVEQGGREAALGDGRAQRLSGPGLRLGQAGEGEIRPGEK